MIKHEPLRLTPDGMMVKEEHKELSQHLTGNSYGKLLYTWGFSSDVPLTIQALFHVPEDAPSCFLAKEPEIGGSQHCWRVLVEKNADGINLGPMPDRKIRFGRTTF